MLDVQEVSKAFLRGTSREQIALEGISLKLAGGEFATILGSNGAGKSTLLASIAGLWPVDLGRIRIAGQDVTALAQHRRSPLVSVVYQDPSAGTCGALTIEENMALAHARAGRRGLRPALSRHLRREFAGRLAELGLGLETRLNDRADSLSGGQRQALTLIMATLRRPAILLLDEHTAALDPATAEKVLAATGQIAKVQGLTVLMVTHNLQQALVCGSRTIMMDRGRIVLDLKDPARRGVTQGELLERFRAASKGNHALPDRTLLA